MPDARTSPSYTAMANRRTGRAGAAKVAPIPWWRSYFLLMRASYRSQMQYRGNFLLTLLGGVLFQTVGLLFVWIIVSRFGSVGGWSMAQIAFLYGMRLVSHGLWMVPCTQLWSLDTTLRNGEFDRYLVRPCGPLLQIFTRRAYLATLGDLIGGIVILVAAASRLSVEWSFFSIGYMLLALVGGAMVEGSFQLAAAAMSFRALSNQSLRNLVDEIFNTFGGYPVHIFPRMTQWILTFALPLAFVAYFPAALMIGRTESLPGPVWLAYMAPLAGFLLLSIAYQIWRRQIRYYSSSGS
ncbi:ABC-2 family transporter protein [Streptomyces sp. BE147]|uniref:ABC transporter permease n=1 Tax=Streptomyces sp. BE147 TaxID=3002524 RepID=UPI002E76C4D3|nr:ABC-2 family transporter protein [Streptomyces sp. BE147]MEE1736691.1 ABC-2 family transporter protein [Streptomyces sp. BE147]